MKKNITINLDIETDKPLEDIVRSLTKGIYRGLDTPPYYVAPPIK